MSKKIEPELAPILIGKEGLSPHDDAFVKEYPTLAQLLYPKFVEEKHLSREPGIVSIKIDGSLYRVSIICPTEGLQAVFGLTTLIDLLTQLEVMASDPATDWTPTYDRKKRQRRRLDKETDAAYNPE